MSQNRATDARPPYFSIEEAVIDHYELHPLAGWLYVVIVRHINRKRNDAFPSLNRLAKIAKMSRASVIRYTKVLEDVGLIEVIREKDENGEKQVNHYRLLPATRVVSVSNYGSNSPQLPVVSDSNLNQKNLNQTNLTIEESSANADGAPDEPEQPEPQEPTAVEAKTDPVEEPSGKVIKVEFGTETTQDTRAALHVAVASALKFDLSTSYSLIEKYSNLLTGKTPEYTKPKKGKPAKHNGEWHEYQIAPGMAWDEIGGFGLWLKAFYPDLQPLRKPQTVNDYAGRYRSDARYHDTYVRRYRLEHGQADEQPAALPVAAGAENQPLIDTNARAEAAAIMEQLTQKLNGNSRYAKRNETQAG